MLANNRTVTEHYLDIARKAFGDDWGRPRPIGPHLTALRPLEPATTLQRRWHVVQTHAQQEALVEKEISKLKLDAYCPREPKKVRVNACKHRTVKRPIIVGYVFAGFDAAAEEIWKIIHHLRGVMRLIKVGERPLPVGDAEMARIALIEQECSGGRRAHHQAMALQVSVLVRILAPLCWSGLFGMVVELDQKKRQVGVEIDLFGRKVRVWLAPEQVDAV